VRSSTASAVTVRRCWSRCWVTAATCRRCRLNPRRGNMRGGTPASKGPRRWPSGLFFHGRNVTRDNTPPAQGAGHQNTGKYILDTGHVRQVPEYEA